MEKSMKIIKLVKLENNVANKQRNTFSKIVYTKMFNWIINKINETIIGNKSSIHDKLNFIGVLDLFGFENFEENWFEQLWINYANEKLQQHFNGYMFKNEQGEYINEGLNIDKIEFKDNQEWINLIEKYPSKTPSIFSLLNEYSLTYTNNPEKSIEYHAGALKEKFDSLHSHDDYEWVTHNSNARNKITPKSKSFSFKISHFAAQVEYKIDQFWDKNIDSANPSIESMLEKSSNTILQEYFKDIQLIEESKDLDKTKTNSFNKSKSESLALQFKDELNNLIKLLNLSSPRYVRWIKPNRQKDKGLFESFDVCRQLRCAGVLEAIRIRKIGYPVRKTHSEFIRRYKPIVLQKNKNLLKEISPTEMWTMLMIDSGFQDDKLKWQIGNSKVFMKENIRDKLEQKLSNVFRQSIAVIIKHLRKWIIRKRTLKDLHK